MRYITKLFFILCVCLAATVFTTPASALSAGPDTENYSDSGYCGKNVTYQVENGVLRIQGTGDMYDFYTDDDDTHRGTPGWDPLSFQWVEIGVGVTSVGANAFAYHNGSPLLSVKLPDTLKRIGAGAFCGCNNLTEIILPEGLEVIEDSAFSGCEALKELMIPNTVTGIGYDILDGTAVPEPHPEPNIDTPIGWAKGEVEQAAALGLLTERTSADYRSSITRLQMAELITNMIEKFTGTEIILSDSTVFLDTDDIAARKAYVAGITCGRGAEGIFAPTAEATWEELAVMLCRAAAYIERHTDAYSGLNIDAGLSQEYGYSSEEISLWALPSVAALLEADILAGALGSLFSPHSNVTVQVAILLTLRLYEKIVSVS